MSNETLKTASVLAFERKLDPSDALFYEGDWNDRQDHKSWPAIGILEKAVRGTISNRLKTKDQDPAKLDAAIENPNLQTVDVSSLSEVADTLKVVFTLRVLPGTGKPSACNNADYQVKLQQSIDGYIQNIGFAELSQRYASNLANGRFLWRNRLGVEAIETHISQLRNGEAIAKWKFDSLTFSLRDFASPTSNLEAVAQVVEQGLVGSEHVLLQVISFVRIGAGQEVYPSQELILDRGRGDKSKTLYKVNDIAAMHSQKVGNALRTIDTWYEGADKMGPIAVEPYGSVTTQGKAYRQPKHKMDFYNLLDGWIIKDKTPDMEQQHFIVATLIRGGVFGQAG